MIDVCYFCTEFRTPGPGRIITTYDQGDLLLLPTLGAFVEGYSLMLPRHHFLSFAEVVASTPNEVGNAVAAARNLVEGAYGEVIIAEHGVGTCNMGAGCVSHAHLHFIPVPDGGEVLRSYEEIGGPGQRIGALDDLASRAGQAYVYLSVTAHDHRIWPTVLFERQFVRKVCARLHGLGDYWDWREFPFEDNMSATIAALDDLLAA